ncbi:MAG: hypothetical protein FWD76_04420 [Firmicutes bacterium]|nr:hypothetical protein [Bacillota bacterium]
MKSVNSATGVESAKRTSKQWIARITKKRWVAVASLSLCFIFCMSFGLQQVLKSKRVESVPVQEVQVSQDFEQLAEKYIDFFVQNDNGTVSLDLSNKLRTSGIDEQDLLDLQAYAKQIEIINGMVEQRMLCIDEDGNYDSVDGLVGKTIIGGTNDFYVRTKKIVFVNVPVGYYFSLQIAVSIFMVTALEVMANNLNVLYSTEALLGYLQTVYNAEQIQAFFGKEGTGSAEIEKVRIILDKLTKGEYSVLVAYLGVRPIVSDMLKLLIGFGVKWLYSNVVPGWKGQMLGNTGLSNPNNTVWMESNLVLGDRKYGVKVG